MTETITAIEVLKSKQNFADYIDSNSDNYINELLKDYPNRVVKKKFAQLTPSNDGLLDAVMDLKGESSAYLFWFIVNEKEYLTEAAILLNQMFSKSYGIFIIKAFLNEDKIDFECLLKPEVQTKQPRNTETPAKLLQKEYWERYFEICDELTKPDFQVNPKPQHFAYISIGKAGVQIMQTINTANNYVATELLINNNKEIYNGLLEHKAEIEKELGEIEWHSPENIKSSKIRKTYPCPVNAKTEWDKIIKKHIKMAEQFKETFSKYL